MHTIIIINHPITCRMKWNDYWSHSRDVRMMMMMTHVCESVYKILRLQLISTSTRGRVCLCVCVCPGLKLNPPRVTWKSRNKKKQTVLDILMHIGLRAQEAVDGRVSVHSNVNEAPKGSCRGKSDAMKYTGSQCAMKNPLDSAAGRSKHFRDHFSVF